MSDSSRPWRSAAHLAGDPSTDPFREGEFPPGADQPPGGISRRRMLGIMGATASMAGLAGCRRPEEAIVPYVNAPEDVIPGVARHYATTMPLGNSAYGLVVESHEGRPTKIEGNRLHPSTLGSSSAQVQAATYQLYDPDRSRRVLQDGRPSTWEDFVAAAAGLRETHLAAGGAGLAVLAAPFSSPTLHRLAWEFRAAFPAARWVTYAPCGEENCDEGLAAAAGQEMVARLHPARARVILSLDADFLVNHPDAIRLAREFADGRRLASERAEMNRLYCIESAMSPTGAAADHRRRLPAGRMGALVAALAAALGLPGAAPAAAPDGVPDAWLRGLAADLQANRGRCLLLAGAHLPPPVHAAVAVLNTYLGNDGATVSYHAPLDSYRSRADDLAALAADLKSGQVKTLLVLGGNPAYDAPVDLGLAGHLEAVETVVHLGSHVDETGRLATWHLPEAHFLESWGDARATGAGISVVQPLIAPLHGGHTAGELLALLAGGAERPAYDLVRETWSGILGDDPLEAAWRKVLHDGILAGSADAPLAPVIRGSLPRGVAEAAGDGLELVFRPDPALHDGRFANVAWLQELPEPITKLTWDNAAWISPATARSLGVSSGDMLRISNGDHRLEIVALEVPGQADGSVSLALGYGRSAAGRVGDGVGFNTYAVRTAGEPWVVAGAHVEKAAGTYPLATTQDHWALDDIGATGRDERLPSILRSATLEEYRRRPAFATEDFHHPELESIYPDHSYEEGPQWGMNIDLTTCTGCNACVVACQSENNVPVVGKDEVARGREMHWIRVDRYYTGTVDDPQGLSFQPVTCQHCENAPCEEVCPVGATVHDDEGLNAMVYNRCIGTRYCSNNCPYKVRRFNYYNLTKDTPELLKMAQNPDVTIRSRGVMEKCTFCTQRIQAAKIDAKAQGRELGPDEPQTACQQACPTRAISFGNILDPQAEVVGKRHSNRSYTMLADLNNRPRTSYLARIRNPRPGEEG